MSMNGKYVFVCCVRRNAICDCLAAVILHTPLCFHPQSVDSGNGKRREQPIQQHNIIFANILAHTVKQTIEMNEIFLPTAPGSIYSSYRAAKERYDVDNGCTCSRDCMCCVCLCMPIFLLFFYFSGGKCFRYVPSSVRPFVGLFVLSFVRSSVPWVR